MDSTVKNRVTRIQIFGIAAIFALLGVSGCEGFSTKTVSNDCTTAKTANITVYDGQMYRMCGCTEGTGTFSQPSSLQCTVTLGTAIYFNFVGINNPHQIAITLIGTTQLIQNKTSSFNGFS